MEEYQIQTKETKINGFLPKIKIKQRINYNNLQSNHNNYDPNSSTSLLIPHNGPIVYKPPLKSTNIPITESHNSYQQTDEDDDYGIKFEETLHISHAKLIENNTAGPQLLTSFPLPRVNGVITVVRVAPPKLGYKNAGTQTKKHNLLKEYLPSIKDHRRWRSEVGDPFIEVIVIRTFFLVFWI